jgi:hypothetical protein
MNGLEIVQDSGENLAAADGEKKLRAQSHLAGINFVETALAILRAQNIPSVEAIDQGLAAVDVVVFEQEMSGHAHAEQREAETTAYLHVDQSERDRNAETTVEDIV